MFLGCYVLYYFLCFFIIELLLSGKAASSIGGCTLHSGNGGLSLRIAKKDDVGNYHRLGSATLKRLQEHFDGLKLVIIDEFSMISQYHMYHIDMRLREICACNKPFGGMTVVLFGDPGQIPPVGASPLWNDKFKAGDRGENDLRGLKCYSAFQCVTNLVENKRVDPSVESSVFFNEFLDRLRLGENTIDDWERLHNVCSKQKIGNTQWEEEGYSSTDATYLYTTNRVSLCLNLLIVETYISCNYCFLFIQEVKAHNELCLTKLGCKIALIRASHEGNGSKFSSDSFRGLESSMYVGVGAKILLTSNLNTTVGLNNGSVGTVKDIVFAAGVKPPNLPLYVWVDFGESYSGESFFDDSVDRKGWFPLFPSTFELHLPKSNNSSNDDFDKHSRTMLPFRLAWAWTSWKAQGLTVKDKLVLNVGDKEKEHGISYVAFSRSTCLENIGLRKCISFERLSSSVRNHKKMQPRLDEESRLLVLANETKDLFANLTNQFPMI